MGVVVLSSSPNQDPRRFSQKIRDAFHKRQKIADEIDVVGYNQIAISELIYLTEKEGGWQVPFN